MAYRLGCLARRIIIPKHNIIIIRMHVTETTTVKRSIRSLLFGKYLIYTNTIGSGLMMAVGNIVQQEIDYQRNILPRRYKWDRVGRMFITGLLLGAPQHLFYRMLDKLLPGNTLRIVAKKVVIDQIIASPCFVLGFFLSMGLLEGKTFEDCVTEIRGRFLTVMLVDLCFWPPTQFINFYYLDGKYRVLYLNVGTMLYNIFLSYIKHVDSDHGEKDK